MVCGTTLVDSAAGPVTQDATGPGRAIAVGAVTPGGIDLITSQQCRHGATLLINPADAARVTKTGTQ